MTDAATFEDRQFSASPGAWIASVAIRPDGILWVGQREEYRSDWDKLKRRVLGAPRPHETLFLFEYRNSQLRAVDIIPGGAEHVTIGPDGQVAFVISGNMPLNDENHIHAMTLAGEHSLLHKSQIGMSNLTSAWTPDAHQLAMAGSTAVFATLVEGLGWRFSRSRARSPIEYCAPRGSWLYAGLSGIEELGLGGEGATAARLVVDGVPGYWCATALAMSPDGNRLLVNWRVAGARGGLVQILQVDGLVRSLVQRDTDKMIPQAGHFAWIDPNRIAVCTEGGLQIWSAETLETIYNRPEAAGGVVAMTLDGRAVICYWHTSQGHLLLEN
jgi:hypothetical protein